MIELETTKSDYLWIREQLAMGAHRSSLEEQLEIASRLVVTARRSWLHSSHPREKEPESQSREQEPENWSPEGGEREDVQLDGPVPVSQEAPMAIEAKQPNAPTAEEVAQHELTPLPAMPLCVECNKG